MAVAMNKVRTLMMVLVLIFMVLLLTLGVVFLRLRNFLRSGL
jgi:hypothetical protein